MSGYMGKYLIVNLSNKSHELVPPADGFYRKFFFGYGLGAAVMTKRQKLGIDPLSPESYLGFCAGLLTGIGAFSPDDTSWLGSRRLPSRWAMRILKAFFQR